MRAEKSGTHEVETERREWMHAERSGTHAVEPEAHAAERRASEHGAATRRDAREKRMDAGERVKGN